MKNKRAGRWFTQLGGVRRSFQEEIENAVEIGARWLDRHDRKDIVVDEIPGWLPPMWGSDDEWLYLRRPEGVWKTQVLGQFGGDCPIFLSQIRRMSGGHSACGDMYLGHSLLNHPGWVVGSDVAHPMDAWERDARELPARRGFQLDADAVASGASIGKLITSEPGKLVVDGGDCFCSQPRFDLQGTWLLGTDPETGYRVGFQLATPALRKSIEAGELWLLFSNRWFTGFEAQVVLVG